MRISKEYGVAESTVRNYIVTAGLIRPRSREAWGRFEEKYTPEPNTGCWLWMGGVGGGGYGTFHYDSERLAHRVSYLMHRGTIGDLCVLHVCDVPLCVNPDHLFLGTYVDNAVDCLRKGRHARYNAKKSTCPYGHPYEGKNLIVTRHGRACRKCRVRIMSSFRNRHLDKIRAEDRVRKREAALLKGASKCPTL